MEVLKNHYLEQRLNEWGDWVSRHLEQNLAYPSMSIEGQLMQSGVIIRCTGSKFPPDNPNAEEIENYVCELGRCAGHVLKDVLQVEYAEPWIPTQAERAKRLNMSRVVYRGYLNMARAWMDGRLRKR